MTNAELKPENERSFDFLMQKIEKLKVGQVYKLTGKGQFRLQLIILFLYDKLDNLVFGKNYETFQLTENREARPTATELDACYQQVRMLKFDTWYDLTNFNLIALMHLAEEGSIHIEFSENYMQIRKNGFVSDIIMKPTLIEGK